MSLDRSLNCYKEREGVGKEVEVWKRKGGTGKAKWAEGVDFKIPVTGRWVAEGVDL